MTHGDVEQIKEIAKDEKVEYCGSIRIYIEKEVEDE